MIFYGAIVNELNVARWTRRKTKVENPLHKLTQITFNFNRRDYGRLRQLIGFAISARKKDCLKMSFQN
jgi:hypothetical protein